MALLRPNTVTIKRKAKTGAVSLTGTPKTSDTTLQSVPALLDVLRAISIGELKVDFEGVVYEATHACFIDALPRAALGTSAAGATLVRSARFADGTLQGVTYTVDAQRLGAFVDLAPGDTLIDEDGKNYLVVGVLQYKLVRPTTIARCVLGRGLSL